MGYVADIGEVYGLMMADQISIRQFPRGAEQPDLCIAGTLLARPEFLQEEREALFGKYGSAVSKWTMVSQVATLPHPESSELALPPEPGESEAGTVRRVFFEAVAAFGMQTLEQQGFAEAPEFPAIHVTPLAVYRTVPTSPQ